MKTHDQQQGYHLHGRTVSGPGVRQLLSTADIVASVFGLHAGQRETYDDLLVATRREVLRQQLFRECFAFEHRQQFGYRRFWSSLLEQVFNPDIRAEFNLTLRLWLIDVGLARRGFRPSGPPYVAQGDTRAIHVVQITREQIERFLGSDITASVPPLLQMSDVHEGQQEEVGERRSSSEGASEGRTSNREYPKSESRPADPLLVHRAEKFTSKALERQADQLRQVLRDYGIQVLDLNPQMAQIGPSVIRYRAKLAPGTKIRDVRASAEDIARELALHNTPIIDNIPGEPFLGIDLELPDRQIVEIDDALRNLPPPSSTNLVIVCGQTP